jgi:histidinol-phosphate aminotransferase
MGCDARAYIVNLQPYQPGLPIAAVARAHSLDPAGIVKLASNENPLGMGPYAKAALQGALGELHRYPEQYDLTQAVATHTGVQPAQVVLGNGSNDVLDLIARTFLGEKTEAVSSQYAFAIYQIATQSAGAANTIVPAKHYAHDLQAMQRAITPQTKVVWIANPNNPTGTFEPYSAVKQFIESVPPEVVIVLDEAYYEYLPDEDRLNTVAWLAEHQNLILVRTFSKVHGLAGLRVGYGLASAQIAELMNRVRHPFNVNVAAIAAATAALGDTGFIKQSIETANAGRRQLLKGLKDLDMECLPAYGNFITFTPGNAAQAAGANEYLLKQGVIVRPLQGYGMPEYLRVTIGLEAENGRFLSVLANWRAS